MLNATQYATLYDAITPYIQSIMEALPKERVIRLWDVLLDNQIMPDVLVQRFQDIIGNIAFNNNNKNVDNEVYDQLMALRRVYLLEINLNLDNQGNAVSKQELQKAFREIVEIYKEGLEEDITLARALQELESRKVDLISQYLTKKFEIREQIMKLGFERQQNNIEAKVDKLSNELAKTNERLDQHFEFLKTVNLFMKETRQENEENKQILNQVLHSLHSMNSKLERLEAAPSEEQKQAPESKFFKR